jgi:Fe-S-cluster containining protein
MAPYPPTSKAQTSCKMCGTCCRKGGPAFHLEDKLLIADGVIPARDLFTIRKGEMARDDIEGRLAPLSTDLIKIKGKKDSWECCYLDKNNQCSLYDHRPLECRVLACWDTRKIERIYSKDRLTRKDLLGGVEGLWELIEGHQAKCDYDEIQRLATLLKTRSNTTARKKLNEIIAYDRHIRSLVFSQKKMDKELSDFLFGVPLIITLRRLGVPI